MDGDFLLKRMILEQACYFCQHNVIQCFMPEDITTYNLHPGLPAMAALHNIVTNCHSDHYTGKAITLLNYIHSLIPNPSTQLHRDYTDILISLKSKAVFYEVFTTEHSCRDDRHRIQIVQKYFRQDSENKKFTVKARSFIITDLEEQITSLFASESESSGEESYSRKNHASMRQAILNLLSTAITRREFQVNVLLQRVKSKGMYEGLTENLEMYLDHVRKIFPKPQLVQEYEKLKSTSESDEENDSAQGQEKNDCLGQPGRLNTASVVLKRPCIHLMRLQSKTSTQAQDLSDTDIGTTSNCRSSDNSDTAAEDEMACVDSPQVTPRVQPMGMGKFDPKQTRVMGSIARKRRFLTGCDNSSCSFLSLNKKQKTRPSFASPEIPLATTARKSFQQQLEVSKQESYVFCKSPHSSSSMGDSVSAAGCDLPVVRKHVQIDVPSTTDSTSNMSDSFLPKIKMPKRGVARHTSRKSSRKRVVTKKMIESDYVSDSDSEAPLQKKNPLHGLTRTTHRIC